MTTSHSSEQADGSRLSIQQDPLLSRHRLRVSLRWWREQRGLTQQQVAEALEWSKAKVVRIESGAVRVSATDVRALLTLYGASDDEADSLVTLARAARRRTWYQDYATALDRDYDFYLSYESLAVAIDTFHFLLIPGLLQTEEYARAVMRANEAEDAEQRIALRLERQVRLIREDGPSLRCVIDEAALYRRVGGRDHPVR
jgi:transcriptional regulator with XRE-family HTH domain